MAAPRQGFRPRLLSALCLILWMLAGEARAQSTGNAGPPLDAPGTAELQLGDQHPPSHDFCSIGELSAEMHSPEGRARYVALRERGNKLAEEERSRVAARGEVIYSSAGPNPTHLVRVAYLIPSNRTPQDPARLQYAIRFLADWYGDQLDRYGLGPKTFVFETEPDGTTPKIHVVHTDLTDTQLPLGTLALFEIGDLLNELGYPVFSDRQIWFVVPESHQLQPDGSMVGGGRFQGFGPGSGDDGGAGMVTSELVALMRPEYLLDDRDYDGVVLPDVGPHSLEFAVSFLGSRGRTISQIAGMALGISGHEVGHAMGLFHDEINSTPFSIGANDPPSNGSIMGASGPMGIRGWKHPARYPANDCRLWYGNALALSVSRYFNPGVEWTDNTPPVVSGLSPSYSNDWPGTVELTFAASDSSGLVCAWLHPGNGTDDQNNFLRQELKLGGTAAQATFFVPGYWGPGVSVFDGQGNKGFGHVVGVIGEQGLPPLGLAVPKPPTITPGAAVVLDASLTRDPTSPAESIIVEWDLDGDGVYDTQPSTDKLLPTSFPEVGVRVIRLKTTDPDGSTSYSSPITVRVLPGASPGLIIH